MRRDLTDAFLRAVRPPPAGRLEVHDTRLTGLSIRVSSAGAMTWTVTTRTADGRQVRPKLGTWPALGLADARRAALLALAVVQQGGDPTAEKRQARAKRAAGVTVGDRLAQWREANAARWSVRYAGEVERVIRADIPAAMLDRALRETVREDWTKLVARKRKTPGAAAFLYRTVAAFLNHAEAEGWLDHPLLPRKGAARLAPAPAARERVLTDAELLAVWTAADREPPKLRAFVRLLLLTATREAEVAGIQAGEVDREASRWLIPATRTKNRHAYTVPLPPLALAELRAVWPNQDPAADHRLLGRSPAAGFTGFSSLKRRLDEASGITAWRFHDLRRTARTTMARLAVPREVAELALNHVSGRSALERTYDRHDYGLEVIAALARWQDHVAALVAS